MHTETISHSGPAGRAIETAKETLVRDIVERTMRTQADAVVQSGVERDKMHEYCHYMVSYLASAMGENNPGMFAEYIDWVKSMLASRGVSIEILGVNLEQVREGLLAGLPPEHHETVTRFLDEGFKELSGPVEDTPSCIDPASPHADLARRYLDAALAGDRQRATRMIMDAFEGGVSIRDMYLQVLEPVQHEIGRLWQINKITVAQEHFTSGVTQLVMSLLYYPHICGSEKKGLKMTAICVSGELHEIGLRMVADLLELDGWEVFFLGANVPPMNIVDTVSDYRADVLGISAAVSSSVRKAASIIAQVKRSPIAGKIKIVVGGYAFNRDRKLWKTVGADYYARDARHMLEIVEAFAGQDAAGGET